MGGLIASAAPKALGAGIGTLIAGGDMGEAAANAVGFGLGGAAAQKGLGGLFGGAGAEAAAGGVGEPLSALRSAAGMMGQQQQPTEVPQAGILRPQARPQIPEAPHPGGASFFQPAPAPQLPEALHPGGASFFQQPNMGVAQAPQPMQGGIANAIPGRGMPSIQQMTASLGPNAGAANDYLMQRGFG
jgi:hypothetical protein